jgi:hypothetical protein
MSLCKNEKNLKGGWTENNPILSLYENENLKRGDRKKHTKKTTMSLCKNEKIQKGGRSEKKKTSYPCMKMKISKGGDKKKTPQKPKHEKKRGRTRNKGIT